MREIKVREEIESDRPVVREINELAFESIEEPDLVDALSALGHVVVSLVAEVEAEGEAEGEAEVVGHILFSKLPIDVGDRVLAAAALAPMAVKPDFQREGIGSELVRAGLERCRELDIEAVVVLGHADYYPRFGFSAELAENLRAPFEGDAFMALELKPGVLQGGMGIVRYAPPFGLD